MFSAIHRWPSSSLWSRLLSISAMVLRRRRAALRGAVSAASGAAVLHNLTLCASWGPGGAALPQLAQMQSDRRSNSRGRRGQAGTGAESERTAPDGAQSGLRAAAEPSRSRVPAAPASSGFLQCCLRAGLRGAAAAGGDKAAGRARVVRTAV
jgi:hypothetical protein